MQAGRSATDLIVQQRIILNIYRYKRESTIMEYEHITHSFEPVYDKNSRILILGTLPSVASRENNFYYGHKQNRFWKLLAHLLDEPVPETIDKKKHMLLKNHIAIWDVIQSCDIKGSSDSSIKNVEPTDIRKILDTADIKQVIANGNKAGQLYKKYQLPLTGMAAVILPSTSPANAAWTFEKLCKKWGEYIKK